MSHGVAAVALAIGATGTGWLLGYLIDLLLGGQRSSAGLEASAFEVKQWLPFAVVGLGGWLWAWRSVVARRRLDPAGEAQSTIRRAFLYLTVAVALVVALAGAALILYRLAGIVFGAGLGGNLASELSTPLGSLVAASAVLLYHALQLRADLALAASVTEQAAPAEPGGLPSAPSAPTVEAGASRLASPVEAGSSGVASPVEAGASRVASPVEPGPAPAGATIAAAVERRALQLIGPPGADLDAALAAARSALPSGIEIVTGDA